MIIKTSDNSIDVSVELNDKTLNDLKQAKKIRISAVDNTNIIDSLETRFLQLDKEDDFDMNENLPQNLSFIYGPPGTGKTTELVRQVRELLTNEPNAKILVLTPTNKAADVVAIKMANDDVCYDGLARYGATESLYLIEDIGCVTNRDTTDLKGWHNIVVATAARYAYDFVQPDDTAICDYPWDYIFIDEASMIDILTITYILYKGANSKRIIISGDPKQIQPVVQNDMPAINIYNMVGLQGFADALFKYTRYPVVENEKVIGILNVKDIIVNNKKTFDLKSYVRKVGTLDSEMIIDDAFMYLNSVYEPFAVVVENKEYVGIVTIEDIIENVIGEVFDEYDKNK